jgi:sporulation protein YlmC with PRC-barrel domain
MLPDLQAHLQQIQQIRSVLPPEPVAQGQSGGQQTAQAPAAPMTAPAGAAGGQLLTAMQPGQFRASKLIGVNIYGSDQGNRNDTDKIGDINEVIVDRMGQIQAVVIGVGGFLGIGEKDVAIPFNQIEWRTSEEVRTSTNTAAPGRRAERRLAPIPPRQARQRLHRPAGQGMRPRQAQWLAPIKLGQARLCRIEATSA